MAMAGGIENRRQICGVLEVESIKWSILGEEELGERDIKDDFQILSFIELEKLKADAYTGR
jgi:hypothetical protein